MSDPLDDLTDIIAVGIAVFDKAQEIFDQCGAADDFCTQYVGPHRVVFGGTNRLIWSPMVGFVPDRSYCTPRFLRDFDNLRAKS